MTVEEKIKNELSQKCYIDDIQDNSRLREDLMLDSLSVVELIIKLEEIFEIELDVGDLSPAGLLIVSDIIAMIMKYVSAACENGGVQESSVGEKVND